MEPKNIVLVCDKVPKRSTSLTRDKAATKEVLKKYNVPTPEDRTFNETYTIDEMLEIAQEIPYPLVVKPATSSLSKGITTDIVNEKQLKDAIVHVRKELGYDKLLVEQCVSGEDTRVLVVNGEVVAAYKRVPSSVTGDGKSTIEELIDAKNLFRKNHPHAFKYMINKECDKLRKLVKEQGNSLSSVVEKGKRVILNDSTLLNSAAEICDVTDEITEKAKEAAVKALEAIPDMGIAGIDVMIDYERDTAYVLEINSRPNLGGNIFPVIGTPRNMPSAIIDYYFPETKELEIDESYYRLYFNYDEAIDPLTKAIVKEVTIPSLPKSTKLLLKKIILEGQDFSYAMRKIIRSYALKSNINGHVQLMKPGLMEVVIAGTENDINIFTEKLKSKKWKKAKIESIQVEDHNRPITLGFKILKPKK